MKPQTFKSLPIGASFRFAIAFGIAGGQYNQIMRKINETEYRGPCFKAEPKPNVLVVQEYIKDSL